MGEHHVTRNIRHSPRALRALAAALRIVRGVQDPDTWLRLSAGKRPTLLVYRVICTDQDAMNWPEEDLGNLRVALNALVRLFRL